MVCVHPGKLEFDPIMRGLGPIFESCVMVLRSTSWGEEEV
jgi:hypothetical protein